jgi:hypothetical protein
MSTLADLLAQYEAEHQFLRRFTMPQEDRALVTDAPWPGGYRWFRSPNVVCLEKVRAVLKRDVEIGHHRGDAA